jgi:hypothetical protein
MIEVIVQPTGDNAEAETPEEAYLAARTLMQKAREHGAGEPTATFLVDGRCVRANVKRAEL